MLEKPGRQKGLKFGKPYINTIDELHQWRRKMKDRDFPYPLFSVEAFLPLRIMTSIASAGPIPTQDKMSAIIGGQWGWERTHGGELFLFLQSFDIPAIVPLDPKPRQTARKRKANTLEGDGDGQNNEDQTEGNKSYLNLLLNPEEPTNPKESSFQLTGYSHTFDSLSMLSSTSHFQFIPSARTCKAVDISRGLRDGRDESSSHIMDLDGVD